jgi:hypothetical protein
MKVTKSIRELYENSLADVRALAKYTDDLLRPIAVGRRWHYESRIKTLESFALKLESGRIDEPSKLEDWFGATFVVPNQDNVKEAVGLLGDNAVRINVKYRRPPTDSATTKPPDSFRFDDLRLYVQHQQPTGLPTRDFLNRHFELQVKTFLQYAWGIATHDKIYKAEQISWGAERIAFQTKATLEHVEASIANLEVLERANEAPSYEAYARRNSFAAFIRGTWEADRLPSDLKRASEIIDELTQELRLTLDHVRIALEAADSQGFGPGALDLSPVQSIVLALVAQFPRAFDRLSHARRPRRILITPEMREKFPAVLELENNICVRL